MPSGAAAAPLSEASEAWAGAAVALAVIAGLLAVLPAGGGGTPLCVAAAADAASPAVSAALPGARVLELDLPARPRAGGPVPAGAPTGTGRPAPLPRSAPVGMAIPALGTTSAGLPLGLEPDGTMEVPPGAYPHGDVDHAGLRPITCGGPFVDEAGGYLGNVVVLARLAGTR